MCRRHVGDRRELCVHIAYPAAERHPTDFLDLPAWSCLRGIAQRRWRYRGGQHDDGVFDRVTWQFITYIWTYRRRMAPKGRAMLAEHAGHAEIIVARTRRGANRLAAELGRTPSTPDCRRCSGYRDLGLAVLAIALGVVCASGVAAAAAPAAATAPIHASASSAVEPLHAGSLAPAHCAIRNGFFRTYYDGCVHWTKYACVALHHFNIKPPSCVSDGCEQAVDLFSGANETGRIICIPGGHASGPLHTKWHSFRITGGAAC